MRKYKSQKIGINPEWVKLYIIKPLSIVFVIAMIMILALNKYQTYATEKAEKESQEAILKESLKAIEDERLKELREQEEIRLERAKHNEYLAQIEIERRKTNTLHENQVSKKILPIGTYLMNNELKKVGRVIGYYGLEVITNNDWNIILDENGTIPKEIEMIGFKRYDKELKKQLDREKKISPEQAYKTNQIYEQERAEQKQKVKEKFGNKKYIYIKFEGKKYFVKDIQGYELILKEQGSKNKIMINAYDKRLKEITPKEYYEVQNEANN